MVVFGCHLFGDLIDGCTRGPGLGGDGGGPPDHWSEPTVQMASHSLVLVLDEGGGNRSRECPASPGCGTDPG